MFSTRATALTAVFSLIAVTAVVALAQKAPEFKVGVNIVNILATVRDQDGRIVNNLTKDDFILEEDGKPQQVTNFFRETDLPLTIGLLIDTSVSQRSLIKTEKSAALQFFEQVLRPDRDLAFLVQFDSDVMLLQDLTPSKTHLEEALENLEAPGARRFARRPFRAAGPANSGVQSDAQFPWPGGGGGQYPPVGLPPSGRPAGTLLYDAVFLAADEVLKNEAGRKTIILISDGLDQGSETSQKQAIETALRADCIIYSVWYYDEDFYRRGRPGIILGGSGGEGFSALKQLSSKTGGSAYEVSKKLSLQDIFEKIQEELRSQYSLSYSAPSGDRDGFRKIKLRAKDKKLKVLTRSGYYAKG